MAKKYEVEVLEKWGTCDSDLFETMAKNGDITAVPIKNVVERVITVLGFSVCEITTDEKTFKIAYFDTEEYGFFSTGSEIFIESVKRYFGAVNQVRIRSVKTTLGTTYKATPILKIKEVTDKPEKKEETNTDELPF